MLRKLAATLLVATFLLSITPRQALHSLLANHTDKISKKTGTALQINPSTYNCDCNSIVATSPFTTAETFFKIGLSICNNVVAAHFSSSVHLATHYSYLLRGPPVKALII